MIEVKELSYHINKLPILKDISLKLNEGEIIGIIGKAGVGKSILLKILAKRLNATKGSLTFESNEYSLLKKNQLPSTICYFNGKTPGNMDDLLYNFLLLSRTPLKKLLQGYSDYDKQVVEDYITIFELDKYSNFPLRALSDSIFHKTLVAFSFVRQSKALFLDNPTNGFDIRSKLQLMKAISKYTINGDTLIAISSNDINFISQVSDRILCLGDEGKIVKEGDSAILTKQFIKELFNTDVFISRNIYNGKPDIHLFSEF